MSVAAVPAVIDDAHRALLGVAVDKKGMSQKVHLEDGLLHVHGFELEVFFLDEGEGLFFLNGDGHARLKPLRQTFFVLLKLALQIVDGLLQRMEHLVRAGFGTDLKPA